MKMLSKLMLPVAAACAVAFVTPTLAGEGPAEKAGKKVDKAADDAAAKADKAADKTGEAADKAADKTKKTAKKAAKKADDAAAGK